MSTAVSCDDGIDFNSLPVDVREKLAELDLELSEGDITQKGYEKKRSRLLAPFVKTPTFISIASPSGASGSDGHHVSGGMSKEHISRHQQQMMSQIISPTDVTSSPLTKAKRRHHRRVTRHESRYHSEVRQEAVQQAIAAMKSKPGKSSVPMPSKRLSSVMVTDQVTRGGRKRGGKDSRRDPSENSSSDDDDDDSTTTGNNDSFSDHNRQEKLTRHDYHQQRHQKSSHSQHVSHQEDHHAFKQFHRHRHNIEDEEDIPPPLPSSARPNFISRGSSSTETTSDRDPSQSPPIEPSSPPALPPRVTTSGHHHGKSGHSKQPSLGHHDYFRDHVSHQRDRNEREREALLRQQQQQYQIQQQKKHQKQLKHEKNRQSNQLEQGIQSKDFVNKPSGHQHHHKNRSTRDPSFDLEEETPQAPPRVGSKTTEDNIDKNINVKHQNNMNNRLIHHNNKSHHNNNLLSHHNNIVIDNNEGTNSAGDSRSGTSSSSSTNEKPGPEKPPERITSKGSNNITLNQLTDLMSKLPPAPGKQSQCRIQSRSLPPPPDVTQTSSSSSCPPPLPPRVSPNHSSPLATSSSGQQHHFSVNQNSSHKSNTSNSNNSNHSCETPAPDYDPVYEHDRQRHQSHEHPEAASLDSHRLTTDSNPSLDDDCSASMTGTASRYKVSAKIQQLLVTLSRPKKRPLPDFYVDDETDLEIAANQQDPSAPKPEGSLMTTVTGEDLSVPAGLPKSLEEALSRYGSATFKAPAVTVLDTSGKIHPPLTYGKLYNRSRKIAYNLLNKVGHKSSSSSVVSAQSSSGGSSVNNNSNSSPLVIDATIKQGDRVALIFPNNDPFGFMCAFYGCLLAGVVPVPIEVPMTRRDAGSTQIGFLLGSCSVSYAITSEACYKGLPKSPSGEMLPDFKAWPRMTWLVTENWSKPPRDWKPPPRISDDVPAYIEYTVDKDGSMKGVSVSRAMMMTHCKALTAFCCYTEGDIMVSVLDFKRDVGLWHSMLTSILNGMHIVFIPYSLMKVNPSSWMLMITKFKATVAVCKSRDLHWGLLATRDHKDVNLSSLRMLLVADGSNPWSLSSCDQFINVFNSRGLKPEAICPCASSPEALTVAVRRPGRTGAGATGRGILSMSALSHGVIRVDQENSLTSLTLQDCGHILPSAAAVVVKINGPPIMCRTDEVGEICVSIPSSGSSSYWGLTGLTNNIFKCTPLTADESPVVFKDNVNGNFIRTGLLGFMGPGSLVFICGSRDGLMQVSGRKHNTDDLIATVLAVEPMKFVYRGRIAIFSIKVLRDERICVVAEQRPDCTEEESFQWMSRVLQAVDSIHSVGIYCLALLPPNQLPKTPLGGIHLAEVKRKFLEGSLHPANVLMCPHTCVTNLPKPREAHPKIGPASVMVGNIVQGNRLAVAHGREVPATTGTDADMNELSDFGRKHQYLSEILKWRATSTPDHNLFTLVNRHGNEVASLTCSSLYKRAERVACFLLEKGLLNTGDYVALIYPPGIDLIVAFYGCLFLGVVPVTIRPPHPANLQTTLPTVRMIVDVSKAVLILSTNSVIKLLKSKEAANVVDIKSWVPTLETDDLPKKKLTSIYRAPTPEMIAYLDFSVSTTGMLAGIKMSHASASSICRSMKLACELYPSRHVALSLDPYCGLGFVLWVLNSIYSGHHSILLPPSEVEVNPGIWLTIVSQNKVRDTFVSYSVMDLCSKGLSSPTAIQSLKQKGVNLSCVRTCVVVAEERPRVNLTTSFSKLFGTLGLSPRAVSTSFGCRVNVGLCLQGASSPDPTTVFVDMRALRNDRVTLVERGSPHSLCLIESGKLLPGVKVVIANPETRGHCGDSNLGEIWVQSSFNASGYFNVYGDESLHNDHFNARLTTGDTTQTYARTGYLGFLRRTESVQADGELHDAVFVVGSLDETVMLRGMRYHPIDIENSVLRCHKKMSECAVFTWTNLLVVVSELEGNENEALDLVPLITNVVLEEHHLIVGVVVVVDPGIIPINSRGEKQRMHLRDGFLADQLDPIYVAYNM